MKRYYLATVMLWAGVVWGCDEKVATAPDLDFLGVDPRTAEVLIPYEDFVDELQVFGGYGSPADFGVGVIASDFGGLNARALVPLEDFPADAEVRGTDGVVRTDADLTFVGGRVLVLFDTVNGTRFPTDVELFDVREEWHPSTVTWEVAVDTAGDRRLWTQPGGGPSTLLGGVTYDAAILQQDSTDAALVDTVSIVIDSATVAALGDPASGTTGLLLAAAEPGVYLNVLNMELILTTVPSTRPDTLLELPVGFGLVSFMVDPVPEPPAGWLRVGGAPSWRSVITLTIPRTVEGTAEFCGTVGCQVDLTEVVLNLAELVLTTRLTESAFQPLDTTGMDVRSVLNPELLPRSPLGETLVPFGFSTEVTRLSVA